MNNFQLSIVTPAGNIFSDFVEYVSAPGTEGMFGVLAHHAPMIAQLKKGLLKLMKNSESSVYAIGSGILEVNGKGEVLILADEALKTDPVETVQNH
jgi:F-type H+-transporting ATPase subunit epsilon